MIYGRSDANIAFGLRRFVSYRGDTREAHKQLELNQASFLLNVDFRRVVEDYFSEVEFDFSLVDFTSLEEYCDLPHSKRELRRGCLREWVESGDFGGNLGTKSALMKMKLAELAKYNAWPRMIFDLSVSASLKGAMVTEVLKEYMFQKPLLICDVLISFIKKPTRHLLRDAFAQLINPNGHRGYFYYFSDDSCVSLRDSEGKVIRGNLDIKQCDASHTSSLFSTIIDLLPSAFRPLLSLLVGQLCLPIRLVRNEDKKSVHFYTQRADINERFDTHNFCKQLCPVVDIFCDCDCARRDFCEGPSCPHRKVWVPVLF